MTMKYEVLLEKILTQKIKVIIEAESQAEAEKKAEQLIEDEMVDFNTGDSDYVEQVTDVMREDGNEE